MTCKNVYQPSLMHSNLSPGAAARYCQIATQDARLELGRMLEYGSGGLALRWWGRYWKLLLAVGSALTGAVLGAAVQAMVDTKLRMAAAGVTVLCILTFGIFAALIAALDAERTTSSKVTASNKVLIDKNQVGIDDLARRMEYASASLMGQFDILSNQIGLHVERVLVSEINQTPSMEADLTLQTILSAAKEICVLDLITDTGSWSDEWMNQQDYSRPYLAALIEKVRTSSPPIIYKRILQLPDSLPLKSIASPPLTEHCQAMMSLRKVMSHRISLRTTSKRFPFKFVLIDGSRLVLQLEEYDERGVNLRAWGELVISDPLDALVSIFREIWDEINDDPRTRSVSAADLAPIIAANDPSNPV